MLRRLTGRAFHKVGAATLKDLSPNDFFIFPDGYFNKTPSHQSTINKAICYNYLEKQIQTFRLYTRDLRATRTRYGKQRQRKRSVELAAFQSSSGFFQLFPNKGELIRS